MAWIDMEECTQRPIENRTIGNIITTILSPPVSAAMLASITVSNQETLFLYIIGET